MRPEFDDRDAAILAERQAAFDKREGPRCGDFVIFPCGTTRRIAHVWKWDASDEGPAVHDLQTSVGGSFYFGEGYMSFSGTLYQSIPASALVDTGETREGLCWFFHHDWSQAHNGVYTHARCRVYRSNVEAPQ